MLWASSPSVSAWVGNDPLCRGECFITALIRVPLTLPPPPTVERVNKEGDTVPGTGSQKRLKSDSFQLSGESTVEGDPRKDC